MPGFTGPQRFTTAAQALQRMLDRAGPEHHWKTGIGCILVIHFFALAACFSTARRLSRVTLMLGIPPLVSCVSEGQKLA